jgi:hypothetical protein
VAVVGARVEAFGVLFRLATGVLTSAARALATRAEVRRGAPLIEKAGLMIGADDPVAGAVTVASGEAATVAGELERLRVVKPSLSTVVVIFLGVPTMTELAVGLFGTISVVPSGSILFGMYRFLLLMISAPRLAGDWGRASLRVGDGAGVGILLLVLRGDAGAAGEAGLEAASAYEMGDEVVILESWSV